MAGSNPFSVMTNLISLNLLNSVNTFRKNSIIIIRQLLKNPHDTVINNSYSYLRGYTFWRFRGKSGFSLTLFWPVAMEVVFFVEIGN